MSPYSNLSLDGAVSPASFLYSSDGSPSSSQDEDGGREKDVSRQGRNLRTLLDDPEELDEKIQAVNAFRKRDALPGLSKLSVIVDEEGGGEHSPPLRAAVVEELGDAAVSVLAGWSRIDDIVRKLAERGAAMAAAAEEARRAKAAWTEALEELAQTAVGSLSHVLGDMGRGLVETVERHFHLDAKAARRAEALDETFVAPLAAAASASAKARSAWTESYLADDAAHIQAVATKRDLVHEAEAITKTPKASLFVSGKDFSLKHIRTYRATAKEWRNFRAASVEGMSHALRYVFADILGLCAYTDKISVADASSTVSKLKPCYANLLKLKLSSQVLPDPMATLLGSVATAPHVPISALPQIGPSASASALARAQEMLPPLGLKPFVLSSPVVHSSSSSSLFGYRRYHGGSSGPDLFASVRDPMVDLRYSPSAHKAHTQRGRRSSLARESSAPVMPTSPKSNRRARSVSPLAASSAAAAHQVLMSPRSLASVAEDGTNKSDLMSDEADALGMSIAARRGRRLSSAARSLQNMVLRNAINNSSASKLNMSSSASLIQKDFQAHVEERASIVLQRFFRRWKRLRTLREVVERVVKRARGVITLPRSLPFWHDPYDPSNSAIVFNGLELELLIRRLTQPGASHSDLRHVFIITHTLFISSHSLLELLKMRFYSKPLRVDEASLASFDVHSRDGLQLSVLSFVQAWSSTLGKELTKSPTGVALFQWLEALSISDDGGSSGGGAGDGRRKHSVSEAVARAVEHTQNEFLRHSSTSAIALLERTASVASLANYPDSILMTSKGIFELGVKTTHALEVARQLCLLDWEPLAEVRSSELLAQRWAKKNARSDAPHVLALIERFNSVSAWAATEILLKKVPEERASRICLLIDIANNLLALSNFSSLYAILSALESAAISRLKHTWELIPSEYGMQFKVLKEIMSMNHNYVVYREKLRSTQPPMIPYMGVLLQDLTFIDDGNPDTLLRASPLINVEKHRMTTAVIDSILACGSEPYCFYAVPSIQALLLRESLPIFDERTQYKVSLQLEPRGATAKSVGSRRKIIKYTPQPGNQRPEFEVGDDAQLIDDLLKHMDREEHVKGTTLVTEGDVGSSMFFLVQGIVQVVLSDGRTFLCNKGSFFGEIAMFLDQPRSATIHAHSDVVVLVLTRDVCDAVMSSYPELNFRFQRLGQERLASDAKGGDDTNSKLRRWFRKIATQAK